METRTYLNVKNLFFFFVAEKKVRILLSSNFLLPYFIKQAPEPSSCVRASLKATIFIQLVARKMLVKSNFKLRLR